MLHTIIYPITTVIMPKSTRAGQFSYLQPGLVYKLYSCSRIRSRKRRSSSIKGTTRRSRGGSGSSRGSRSTLQINTEKKYLCGVHYIVIYILYFFQRVPIIFNLGWSAGIRHWGLKEDRWEQIYHKSHSHAIPFQSAVFPWLTPRISMTSRIGLHWRCPGI